MTQVVDLDEWNAGQGGAPPVAAPAPPPDPAALEAARLAAFQQQQDPSVNRASETPVMPRQPVAFQREQAPQPAAPAPQAQIPQQQQQAAPAPPPGLQAPNLSVRVSGGGMTPGREVETLGKTGKAMLQKSIDAGEQYANVAQEVAQDKQVAHLEVQEASQEHRRQLAEHEAAIQRDQAEYREKHDKLSAEISSDQRRLADMKVDPHRWWNSKTDLQKAGWVVGGALSGFLEGYTKGRVKDETWSQMMAESERDTAAQEKAYMRAQGQIEAKKSAFGQLVQRYGTPDAARNQINAIKSQQFATMAETAAAKIGSADAKLAAAQIREKADQYAASQTAQAVKYIMPQQIAPKVTYVDPATGVRLDEKTAQQMAQDFHKANYELQSKGGGETAKMRAEIGKHAVALPDGTVRFAQNEHGQKEAEKLVAGYAQINDAYKKALSLREQAKNAAAGGNLAEAARIQQELNAHAVETAKRIETGQLGQGILREQEMPVMKNEVLGFTSMRPGTDETIKNRMAYGQKQLGIELSTRAPMVGRRTIVNGVPQYEVTGDAAPANAGPPPGAVKK